MTTAIAELCGHRWRLHWARLAETVGHLCNQPADHPPAVPLPLRRHHPGAPMRTRWCVHRWTGEIRDHSGGVGPAWLGNEHLCNQRAGHRGDCQCVCGATTTREDGTR